MAATQAPGFPDTGGGPSAQQITQPAHQLAETGAGPQVWLLAGLVFLLIGLLGLRLLDKLDRQAAEDQSR